MKVVATSDKADVFIGSLIEFDILVTYSTKTWTATKVNDD